MTWKLDRECATVARTIMHAKLPAMRMNRLPRNRQAEAETAAIGSRLNEGCEKSFGCSFWQSSAGIFHVDEHMVVICRPSDTDFSAVVRELDCIVYDVRQGRRDEFAIDFEKDVVLTRDLDVNFLDASGDVGLRHRLGNQCADGNGLSSEVRCVIRPCNFEGALDEISRAGQAPFQQFRDRSECQLPTRLQKFERQLRGREGVSELVGDERKVFVGLVTKLRVSLSTVLDNCVGDAARDGIAEHLVFGCAKARPSERGSVDDASLKKPVFADDGIDVEAETEPLKPMLASRRCWTLRQQRFLFGKTQRIDQLVQELGDMIDQLKRRNRRVFGGEAKLGHPAPKDVIAVPQQELVQLF